MGYHVHHLLLRSALTFQVRKRVVAVILREHLLDDFLPPPIQTPSTASDQCNLVGNFSLRRGDPLFACVLFVSVIRPPPFFIYTTRHLLLCYTHTHWFWTSLIFQRGRTYRNLLYLIKNGGRIKGEGKTPRTSKNNTSQRRKTQGPGKGLEEAKNRSAPRPGKRAWEGLQPQKRPSKSPITTGTGLRRLTSH